MPTTEPMERTEAVRLLDELKREAAGRTRRGRLARGAGSAIAGFAVAALLVWSLGALEGLGERSDTARGEPGGYILTDLHLAGPDEGPDRGPSAGEVRVGFSYGWSGNVFPGTHACTIVVLDAAGSVVGTQGMHVTTLGPELARDHWTDVPVDGRPEEVQGGCDGGRLDTPIAMIARDPALADVTPRDDGTFNATVSFTLESPALPDGEYPSEQECDVSVVTADGRSVEVEQAASTYSVPDGERVEDGVRIPIDAFGADLPEALEALTDSAFDVTCHPYDWP